MTERVQKIKRSARALVCTPLHSLLNRLDPPVIVLLYHRVTSLPADPEMLAVTPDNFRAQMRHLKDTIPVVRFEEDWTTVKKPSVAVTFDDGYADNVLEALPILEDLGIPATFFVSTGAIGTRSEFWWHELERIILDTETLPPRFALLDEQMGRSWPTVALAERQEFYHGIMRLMNEADAGKRTGWLEQMRRWADTEEQRSEEHTSELQSQR